MCFIVAVFLVTGSLLLYKQKRPFFLFFDLELLSRCQEEMEIGQNFLRESNSICLIFSENAVIKDNLLCMSHLEIQ